ncbi:hypothetical protein EFI48_12395 [Aeromonas veronii]|uniref:Uncharacterized protein n=1 Tax=Aeromonas veronii TaxID=654 RepID=A0AAN1UQ09_AERVE|nr:hypothetical protein EFI48_12395 [Aeromonas veronii]
MIKDRASISGLLVLTHNTMISIKFRVVITRLKQGNMDRIIHMPTSTFHLTGVIYLRRLQ